jgi:prepilin-type N-terminal cleavage/methylation domain-containing protein
MAASASQPGGLTMMTSTSALLTKSNLNRPNHSGFSLMEVLAGITLLSIFIAIGMQAMVNAVALQVGTDRTTHADDWIQADVESVRFLAGKLPKNDARCYSLTQGYAAALQTALENTTNRQTFTADGGNYALNRTTSTGVDGNVLVLQYQIVPTAGGAPIASKRVEVMPDAALQCP